MICDSQFGILRFEIMKTDRVPIGLSTVNFQINNFKIWNLGQTNF